MPIHLYGFLLPVYPFDKVNRNKPLEFSFACQDNGKNYLALNKKDEIFEPGSRYATIDIFEIIQTKGKYIYVSDIPENEWNTVKKALQFNVFAKMN